MNCTQTPGCKGEIQDGYCNECGMKAAASRAAATAGSQSGSVGSFRTGTTRRRNTTRSTTVRNRLGAGLVDIAPIPERDPASAVLANPEVPEDKRFCSIDAEPVGRSRPGVPGRTEGFCRKCGQPFSFTPKLKPGDIVAGQYDVAGCLAHGGLGWIYLTRDRRVADRWVVLKGLLNTSDKEAMAAAMAERRFLAEVEHPNIVKIYNFVEHQQDGYIVMEYVDGMSLKALLESRRLANGGAADPLPVAHAIAYVLEILPALGYLHKLGLLFCDFKPDNVIQTASTLKLIDLGGVYRMNDDSSPIYGTAGYQAPEIADTGPTIPSDLFTVGRTLAVLCTNFRGYQSAYEFTLPAPDEVPEVYGKFNSLYRFLERATAPDPDYRFQTAEEMADQLLGVLREVVAAGGDPAPGPSTTFSAELRGAIHEADWRCLPAPLVRSDDPATAFLSSITTAEPEEVAALLEEAPERTVEVELRLSRALIELGRFREARDILERLGAEDPWEWRADWYRGLAALAAGQPKVAADEFAAVYRALPGELAPRLGMAQAAELSGDLALAARWYETVCRTDPGFTTATFGLARCRLHLGARADAVSAYDRIPETSRLYLDAQIAKARAMLHPHGDNALDLAAVTAASSVVERLSLEGEQRAQLVTEGLETALRVLPERPDANGNTPIAFGHALDEPGIRRGLEQAYRELARRALNPRERVLLVDRANEVRPRTFV